MEPAPHRRRPRGRPPAPPDDRAPPARPADGAHPAPPRGPNPFRLILAAGAVVIVAVIVVAAATGTADDLPWGAIIGVAVVMAFAYVAGRRRRLPPEDEGRDEDG